MTIAAPFPVTNAQAAAATNTWLRHVWFGTREPNAQAIEVPAAFLHAITTVATPLAVNLRHRQQTSAAHLRDAVPNHFAGRYPGGVIQSLTAPGNQRQSVEEARGAIEPRETRGGHAPRAGANKGGKNG